MKKTIFLTIILSTTFLLSSCFKKNDEDMVKKKLKSLASELSFESNVVPLKQVFKTKKIIEKYFHGSFSMDLKIRQSNFNIPNIQVMAQNLFLLNKMVGQLSLEFQNIKMEKVVDEKGFYYKVVLQLDAVGKDAQLNKDIDEEIPYVFYLRKYDDQFLIFKGENLLEDSE